MVLLLLAPAALAVGGVFAGPIGADPPTSSGVQLSISPDGGRNVLVLTARVASGATDMAVLWPMAEIDPDSVEEIEPSWFERIEEFTRPRVEKLRCDELVEVVHWGTPPGCASEDYVPPPETRGEDAVDDLALGGAWAGAELYTEVVAAADIDAWLAERSLELPFEMRERLEPHVTAGETILAIRPQTPVEAGEWLSPVRFSVPAGDLTLPLTLGVDLATTQQDLVIYGVSLDETGNVGIENFPRGVVADDCVLPADLSADAWYASSLDELDLGAEFPTWVVEYAGSAATCGPCVSDPLEAFEVRDFGLEAEAEDARVSRIHLRWDRNRLDEDPVVDFPGDPVDATLRWYAHDARLGFAYPTCGEPGAEQDGTCSNIRPPEEPAGCSTNGIRDPAGPARAGLLLVGLALVAARRRGAPLLALLLLLSAPARGADREPDPGPRTEVHLGLAVLGTDRVVPDTSERGAPWALNPYLGADVRRSFTRFARGTSLGVIGQLRGWSGDAAPGLAGAVGFTLLEPAVGLDLRHGQFREGSPCWMGRYGASLALPTLLHGVTGAEVAPGVLLHGGVGAWIGRGLRRGSIELRGSVLPRTDGYQTVFAPEVGVPGWMFFPGTANLWIVAGVALY